MAETGGLSRRTVLKGVGAGTAIAWTAPVISGSLLTAASASPVGGRYVAYSWNNGTGIAAPGVSADWNVDGTDYHDTPPTTLSPNNLFTFVATGPNGLNNDEVDLTLSGLPANATVRWTFDFYGIATLDGSGVSGSKPAPDGSGLYPANGPFWEYFTFDTTNTPDLFRTNFALYNGPTSPSSWMAFPLPLVPDSSNLTNGLGSTDVYPAFHDASATDSLGYSPYDATWSVSVGPDNASAGGAITIRWSVTNIQTSDDEDWGINNLVVTVG